MNKWLIIDCHYLCYRALYTTGGLTHNEQPTGTLFGFFRDIFSLQELHETDKLVFCFDSKKSKRRDMYPAYKEDRIKKREELSDKEKMVFTEMYEQIGLLRKKYLPKLGFNNVFYQSGHEADDLIASITMNSIGDDEAIIVASDKDLFQLLTPFVSIWNSNKRLTTTYSSFVRDYGIMPIDWITVKAMAGCSSDGVKGIAGVGEKTAAKYIQGELKKGSKAYTSIENNRSIVNLNLDLVKLPFMGTNKFELQDNNVTKKKWEKLASKLGINSLRHLAFTGFSKK